MGFAARFINRGPDGRHDGRGVERRAHDQRDLAAKNRDGIVGKLVEREIDLRFLAPRAVQPVLPDVTDHADNARCHVSRRAPVRNGDALADRVAAWKRGAGEDGVHQNHQLGMVAVRSVERTAAKKRDAHRARVIRPDRIINGPWNLAIR